MRQTSSRASESSQHVKSSLIWRPGIGLGAWDRTGGLGWDREKCGVGLGALKGTGSLWLDWGQGVELGVQGGICSLG